MAASSSGLKTDFAGSAPATLISSNTEASQEKVSRAEGTCKGRQNITWDIMLPMMTCPHPIFTTIQIPSVSSLKVSSPSYRMKTKARKQHKPTKGDSTSTNTLTAGIRSKMLDPARGLSKGVIP